MHWMALGLVVCVALILWRVEVALGTLVLPYLDRRVERVAQEAALVETLRAAAPVGQPVPHDLDVIANRETEAWARDAVRAVLLDEYAEVLDWDVVRDRHFGGKA